MHFCVDPRQLSRHFEPTFLVEGEENFVIKQGFVFRPVYLLEQYFPNFLSLWTKKA
jgi:hypothetical protein